MVRRPPEFDALLQSGKKKPTRAKVDIRGTLSSKRNYRVAIREAALRGVTCILLYKKATTGEIKRYEVIPTEYAYRRNKDGAIRKALWVQDCRDGSDRRQIKLFYMRNIIKSVVTNRRLKPKWPILIV